MPLRPYDAVVIFGGGLRKEGEEYFPATYADSDNFGMLGGHMRVNAAIQLWKARASENFIFTTGVYDKNIAKFGQGVPEESKKYAAFFAKKVGEPAPNIVTESISTTTLTNLEEVEKILQAQQWKNVAFVSNEYHLPRIRALYERMFDKAEGSAVFLSAEEVVRKLAPGMYDAEIEHAYATEAAKRRIANEQQGVEDIREGKYTAQQHH
jgi:uncharacterized SAM-binding protein YcdF (DUF218 family)